MSGDNWISVEDRLPDVEVEVLTVGTIKIYGIDTLYSCGEITEDGGWWVDIYAEDMWKSYVVTHWQPLPPPPTAAAR